MKNFTQFTKIAFTLLLLTLNGWSTTDAQIEVKTNPISTILLNPSLGVEYYFASRFSIELNAKLGHNPSYSKAKYIDANGELKTYSRGQLTIQSSDYPEDPREEEEKESFKNFKTVSLLVLRCYPFGIKDKGRGVYVGMYGRYKTYSSTFEEERLRYKQRKFAVGGVLGKKVRYLNGNSLSIEMGIGYALHNKMITNGQALDLLSVEDGIYESDCYVKATFNLPWKK